MGEEELRDALVMVLIRSGIDDHTPGRTAELNGQLVDDLVKVADRYALEAKYN